MQKLTTKQEKVLTALKKEIAKNGYPPTVRELCKLTNLSSSATIQVHLDNLSNKGYIKKGKEKNRTIELLVPNEYKKTDDKILSIPLLGNVPAGDPIEAITYPDEYIEIPSYIINNNKKEIFSLKIKGNSMINAGILDKDIVIIEKTNIATNKDYVVVMNKDNEVTVKTFYKEKDHIRLQPENDNMVPILLKECTILGKIIGLYRKY